ncbi:alpha/beta hydrolase [Dinghuibacter silviterrae]|uniref:Alpha/beta hydrolase family protein n=1 Tax=Dinghuibacter silviterrae TaxID=1539049 RepID=A0A4R8DUU8_9BACT|nr:alpha/beta hydrolase [Dinghuibacter silviterrae]TDX01736.1 alpha/beta hydrolase family protein [Dinghuibacter silviterrae]
MTVYCISGLGADARVFEHLTLPGLELVHLPWLQPLAHEPIAAYAARMTAAVRHEKPILMGMSFGGIMAIEMAKYLPLHRLWLISTVKQRREMPLYMRMGKTLPLHKLFLPLNPQRWMGPLENYNLGVETPDEYAMVAEYRRSVNTAYLRWAINAIINWEASSPPGKSLHIHGGKDRIFPVGLAKPDHIIPGAGHLMVHNRADQVSRLLLADL